MSTMFSRSGILAAALATFAQLLGAGLSLADCPQQDLTVVLNTGWDESTGAGIPPGGTDDDWDVIGFDPSGGSTPRDADVIAAHPAWLTLPNSQWIAADQNGPNGTYIYEICWCMDDEFANPNLSFAIRADDQAEVYLNGNLVLALPTGTFNDPTVIGITVVNPALFNAGLNCMTVHVDNLYGAVTGFDLTGTVTADDALCCDCDSTDIADDGSTGVDDTTTNLIASTLDDDEWIVTDSPISGPLPRPAEVIDTFIGWNVIPGTKWITDDEDGPNGLYVYEKCWCMNPAFENAQLDMELLADDRASVFLNGNLIGSTPAVNAFIFPATSITTADQDLFVAGENCVQIEVTNVSAVVTGLDVSMTVTAENAECCPCVEPPAGLEGWWPLDEPVGPIASELLNGHDGTWFELTATPPPPTGVPGMVGGALELDGADDYVEVPDAPGLDFGIGQDFSFDAWIKTTTNVRQSILHKKKPGLPWEPGYAFGTSGMLNLEISDGLNFVVCVGTANVADGDWHFVAATVDRDQPGGIVLYVDGVIDQTCDPTSVAGSLENDQQLYFGADPLNIPNARKWWDGPLDEIEIFRRALDPIDVERIYLAGDSGKCPPAVCAGMKPLPECDVPCPPGLTCVNNGQRCHCELEPHCGGPGDFPICDDACPEGFTCELTVNACECIEDMVECEDTLYPECGGSCPNGDVCTNLIGTDFCHCEPEPVACGDPQYPVCDGACPANQVCKPTANEGCSCFICGTGVPLDPPIVINWGSGHKMRWTPVSCALVYNVYRGGEGHALADTDEDGLADDYGSCHIEDIIGTEIVDPGSPPPGTIHWYLVTAENFAGEGSLGENSRGQPRQATGACP